MQSTEDFFKELYDNFNAREIEKVITQMAENVKWANGMEGGDAQVRHIFTLENGKVSEFQIGEG